MRTYEISMDGEKGSAKLTLNLGALAELSAREHDLWMRYNTLYQRFQKGEPNELEMAELIYIAYRCAALFEPDTEPMDMSHFLMAMTDDREEIGDVFGKLYGVHEKKLDSQMASRKQRMTEDIS